MWANYLLSVAALAAVSVGSLGLADDQLRDHTVLRAVPATPAQQLALRQYLLDHPSVLHLQRTLSNSSSLVVYAANAANAVKLDVWAESAKAGRPTDVSLSPEQREDFAAFLRGADIHHEVFVDDVHRAVQEHMRSTKLAGDDETFGWTQYYNLQQIYKWMQDLADSSPATVSMNVVNIGDSHQGKPIKGLVIKFAENLPVAFIESGIHAREWIGPASATYFVDQILNSADDDIVRKYEWHIFPSVNPDGYVYTWTKDRLWRKTRSTNWLIFRGVDANRNWPFHWMESGANTIPYSEIYGGPHAESEQETKVLRKYVDGLAERMHVYVSLHSYSQLLMFPWGYTRKRTPTHNKLNDIAKKALDAIAARNGTRFDYGNIAETIYEASGSTLDYVYSKCVPYPFVFELRDQGKFGFLLPADQILDAAAETWDGIKVIVDEAYKAGVPHKNPSTC